MSQESRKLTLLAALLLCGFSVCAQSARSEQLTVLLIGNSYIYYNAGVGKMLEGLAASDSSHAGIKATELTMGGATIKGAWDYFVAGQRVPNEHFDFVVIQDTLGFGRRDEDIAKVYVEYATRIDQWAKQSGGSTILYMEQPHSPAWEQEPSLAEREQVNSDLGGKLGAAVAPVAIAWQNALVKRPALKLYGPDGLHPSKAGTYLVSCVLYSTITKRSTVGLAYYAKGLTALGDDLSLEDAAFLQQIAWEAFLQYRPASQSR